MRRALLALSGLLLLAACGGGTTQIEPFKPTRLLAFGDEASVITSTGRKFGVNALDSSDNIDCLANPLWTQAVANAFGLVFAECNPTNAANPAARSLAAPDAKLSQLVSQIDAQVAAGGFTATDLVMVLVGTHDVLEQYARYPASSEAEITAELQIRGASIAQQVNRLASLGAKVIVSTVPDLGVTPFALAEKAAHPGTDRAALLQRLTAALNARLRTTILNDGRLIGLVLADEMTEAMVRSPLSFGLTNTTQGVCSEALPNCTTKTVVSGGVAGTWLWADVDGYRLAPTAQSRLGILAQARALGNPF